MVLHILALCCWYGLGIINAIWTYIVIRKFFPVDGDELSVLIAALGAGMLVCCILAANDNSWGMYLALAGILLHACFSVPAWYTAQVRLRRIAGQQN